MFTYYHNKQGVVNPLQMDFSAAILTTLVKNGVAWSTD